MGRILGIDYGTKRVGIAVTDPLKIIASPLDTVEAGKLMDFIVDYLATEEVEAIVVGWPQDLMGKDTHSTAHVGTFIEKLEEKFPDLDIIRQDERFTSKIAFQAMLDGGMKKKDRQNKGNIDKISASIILQSYLDMKKV